jgi:hypothetical protein
METVALGREDESGRIISIAVGSELVRRALLHRSKDAPASA